MARKRRHHRRHPGFRGMGRAPVCDASRLEKRFLSWAKRNRSGRQGGIDKDILREARQKVRSGKSPDVAAQQLGKSISRRFALKRAYCTLTFTKSRECHEMRQFKHVNFRKVANCYLAKVVK